MQGYLSHQMRKELQDIAKNAAAIEAAKLIKSGMLIGLGTGSTSHFFIEALAKKYVDPSFKISAVASSEKSAQLAKSLGITLCHIDQIQKLDVTVDGADQIDSEMRMIKGGGGALLREKIIASASSTMIVIIDESKLVQNLCDYPVPVEVTPFGHLLTFAKIEQLGATPKFRQNEKISDLYVTDNGNYIIDVTIPQRNLPKRNICEIERSLKEIPGVVETGFFFNLAKKVIIGYPDASTKSSL